MVESATVGILVCSVICVIMFGTPLAITELVFAARYKDITTCNNTTVLLPTTWLAVDGAMALAALAFFMPFAALTLFKPEKTQVIVTMLLASTVFTFFNTAWTIVGAVMFWRDNKSCSPEPLYKLLYASIIIHLIGYSGTLCNSRSQFQKTKSGNLQASSVSTEKPVSS